jgi:hypothetical protein
VRTSGLSRRMSEVSFFRRPSGSRSERCVRRLPVSTRAVRFGAVVARLGDMCAMRLRASRRVWRRGERGILERDVSALSVKSMASWSCRMSH